MADKNINELPEQISGDRIVLRRWQTSDAKTLSRLISENIEHLTPWMPWVQDEPLPIDKRLERIEDWELDWRNERNDVLYGIFQDEMAAGGCGLHGRIGPGGLEIGYWVHQNFLNRGIATETARLLTSAAFAMPGIDRVEIHHDKANLASAAVPRKLGFTFVGERPDNIEAPGEVGIDCTWRCTRSGWQAQQEQSGA